MYGSWKCFDLENLQFWFDKETTIYRQFHLQKTINCDLWKLFCSKLTEIIIVEIQLIDFGWQMSSVCYQIIEKK